MHLKTIFAIRVDEWLINMISAFVLKNILPSYCIWLYRMLARVTVEHQYNLKIALFNCFGGRHVGRWGTAVLHLRWPTVLRESGANIVQPDPQHTSRRLSIYRGPVRHISPTYMPDEYLMWYLPDSQQIL